MVLHDVPALTHCHHCDLLLQFLQVLSVLNADDADCVEVRLVVLRANTVHLAHTALANLLEETVFQSWLYTAEDHLLQTGFELAGRKQLPFKFALVYLIAVTGDHLQD